MVDDERNCSGLLEARIRNWIKDVKLLIFADGEEAWQELLRTDPDLLITDMERSTTMDGWQMLQLLADRKVTVSTQFS